MKTIEDLESLIEIFRTEILAVEVPVPELEQILQRWKETVIKREHELTELLKNIEDLTK